MRRWRTLDPHGEGLPPEVRPHSRALASLLGDALMERRGSTVLNAGVTRDQGEAWDPMTRYRCRGPHPYSCEPTSLREG